MNRNSAILASHAAGRLDPDEYHEEMPDGIESAIAAAQAAVAGAIRARRLRDAAAGALQAEIARRPVRAVLPVPIAAVLSVISTLAVVVLAWAFPQAQDRVLAIPDVALMLDAAVLGAGGAISTRCSGGGRGKRLLRRLLAAAAFAMLAVLVLHAGLADGASGVARIAIPALAGTIPWLLARLATPEARRLEAELASASAHLAMAERAARAAVSDARSQFEKEIATVDLVVDGRDGQDARHMSNVIPPLPRMLQSSTLLAGPMGERDRHTFVHEPHDGSDPGETRQ